MMLNDGREPSPKFNVSISTNGTFLSGVLDTSFGHSSLIYCPAFTVTSSLEVWT